MVRRSSSLYDIYKFSSYLAGNTSHHVSTTKPNRLMLFKEIIAVYCENHTEHTDPVRTSQETHYVSATKPNRLMLFRETVAVCFEKNMKHINILCKGRMQIFFSVK
jgi:hypothetical protein